MKKRNWFILLAVALMSTTMIACGNNDDDDDDDDNTTPTLEMAMDVAGTEYDLDKGVLILYGGDATDGYDNDIALASPSIQWTITNNDLDTIYGTGHTFYIECVTNAMADMTPGTYTYDTVNVPQMTFYGATYQLNYNMETDNGVEKDIVGGTFTVAKDATEYTLEFDGTDEDGNTVKMHYKGTLETIDWSKKKGDKKKLF